MYKFLVLLIFSFSLFADTLSIPANSAVYPIDVSQRGAAILNMFTYLSQNNTTLSANQSTNTNYTIGIQTTSAFLPAPNSFLQPIRNIYPTANHTILIVNIGAPNTITPINQITYVIPVEQIAELVYNNKPYKAPPPICTQNCYPPGIPIPNTVPYFSIDSSQRALDISNAFSILNSTPYYYVNSKVSIQTTLSGNFYSPIPNGLIANVQSIQLINGLLLIGYSKNAPPYSYIVVEADQISSITYSSGQ